MVNQIKQSFIFAAGRGERMRPLTDSLPKPLALIKNKAIIDYIIEKLDKITSIEKIIVNGFYLADLMEKHLHDLKNDRLIFSHEPFKMETGGGLLHALRSGKIDENAPILLINGDIFWQDLDGFCDVEEIYETYLRAGCDIMLGLKKTGEFFGYEGRGDFNFDVLTQDVFGGGNQALSHVFIGVQVVNPKILRAVNLDCFSMNYFYKDVSGAFKIKGYELKGKYFHIGDSRALNEINNM